MYAPCKFLVGSISSLLVPFVYRKPVLSPAVALHTLHIMKLFVRDNYIESSADGMGVKKTWIIWIIHGSGIRYWPAYFIWLATKPLKPQQSVISIPPQSLFMIDFGERGVGTITRPPFLLTPAMIYTGLFE